MLRRIASLWDSERRHPSSLGPWALTSGDLIWSLGSLCALHRIPFDAQLFLSQFSPPYTTDTLIHAAREVGFKAKLVRRAPKSLHDVATPCLALVAPAEANNAQRAIDCEESSATLDQSATTGIPRDGGIVLISQAGPEKIVLFESNTNTPKEVNPQEFASRYLGAVLLVAKKPEKVTDDHDANAHEQFGFRWFFRELLKHKQVWRDVLLASLVIQLLALGTPLFTQTIIDKVVVHRTQSTLFVIAFGLAVFMIFSAILTWVRQYLIVHTGNRVDAVLAAAVFDQLFKLPLRYFEKRPTGVISARLHGVETIREFVAGAAVTLVLDLPFLIIFVCIMFWYSVILTVIALAILGIVAGISFAVAPQFQTQLNHQFQLGARNQAFLTEYIGGMETVKSLQMEPHLKQRYGDYLADYLHATFRTRQLANSYNTAATTLEQLMSVVILIVGAYMVMTSSDFTIGMLVAFQMFSGRLAQPMMRLVGLWQQFQQARLSVMRLGDIMNAPTEPYSLLPSRLREGKGKIEMEEISFRHSEKHPWLYRGFNLTIPPGSTVAVMGPSGSGKSTLAKLLQGFYIPGDGRILIDNTDIQNLSANELRHYFGVVPQETVLFSGTIFSNLQAANPHATFDQIVHACRLAEIHEVVEKLPNGYQTEVGERGSGLSGGQRQRLAIARALLKRPKILIFDEATSALDPVTAEHFAATINQLKGKVTMLFITHALPKSLHVDEVVRIGGEKPSVVGIAHEQAEAGVKQ